MVDRPDSNKCKLCNFEGTSQTSLSSHSRVYHGLCTKCDRIFDDDTSFKDHKAIGCVIECDKCNYTSHDKRIYRLHVSTKHKFCWICEQTIDDDMIKHMGDLHGEKTYKCDQCDYHTLRYGGLVRHQWIHASKKRLDCNLCDSSFNYLYRLTSHKWTIHGIRDDNSKLDQRSVPKKRRSGNKSSSKTTGEISTDTDPKLNKIFTEESNKEPPEADEDDEVPEKVEDCQFYKCEVCSKELEGIKNLKEHFQTDHENIRLDKQCEKCEFVSVFITNLMKHRKTYHAKMKRSKAKKKVTSSSTQQLVTLD